MCAMIPMLRVLSSAIFLAMMTARRGGEGVPGSGGARRGPAVVSGGSGAYQR
jgi:hypothetical protein